MTTATPTAPTTATTSGPVAAPPPGTAAAPTDAPTDAAATPARLAVTGELDAGSLPRFCAQLQEVLAARPGRLELDLSGCPFVDAAALGVLVDAHRATARYGAELVLTGCTPRVLRVLSLTGLARVFTLV